MAKRKQKNTRSKRQNKNNATYSRAGRTASIAAGLVAFLASAVGVFTFWSPSLVAKPQDNQFNGQIRSDPGNGITVWIDGSVVFQNRSVRGGGRVSGLNVLAVERDSSAWLPVRVSTVEKQEFSAFEEKRISFSLETNVAQLKKGEEYPPLNLAIRFLDGTGKEIRRKGDSQPYELKMHWPSHVLGSLKQISG